MRRCLYDHFFDTWASKHLALKLSSLMVEVLMARAISRGVFVIS
jgi:hypothetical protein